jgi:hypothetical protein
LKLERCAPILPAVGSAIPFLRPGKDLYGLASRARTPAIRAHHRGAVQGRPLDNSLILSTKRRAAEMIPSSRGSDTAAAALLSRRRPAAPAVGRRGGFVTTLPSFSCRSEGVQFRVVPGHSAQAKLVDDPMYRGRSPTAGQPTVPTLARACTQEWRAPCRFPVLCRRALGSLQRCRQRRGPSLWKEPPLHPRFRGSRSLPR